MTVASSDLGFNKANTLKFIYDPDDPDAPAPINHTTPKRKIRMNAFCPGCLCHRVNSCDEYDNVYLPRNFFFDDSVDEDNGARSRYIHGGLQAKYEITAGSELFLWYGPKYHGYLRLVQLTADVGYETLEEFKSRHDFSKLPTEQDKKNLLNTTSMRLRDDMPFSEREKLLGAKRIKQRYFNKTKIREPPKDRAKP